MSLDVITFWSITGQKLGDYALTGDPNVVYSWNNYNGTGWYSGSPHPSCWS